MHASKAKTKVSPTPDSPPPKPNYLTMYPQSHTSSTSDDDACLGDDDEDNSEGAACVSPKSPRRYTRNKTPALPESWLSGMGSAYAHSEVWQPGLVARPTRQSRQCTPHILDHEIDVLAAARQHKKAKRARGRPIVHTDPSHPSAKRREKDRQKRSDTYIKRPVGRPRSSQAVDETRAACKRKVRVHNKVAGIAEEAARKIQTHANNYPLSWTESFDQSPVNTMLTCVRTMGNTPTGRERLPDVASGESKRLMFEQVGVGTCHMLEHEAGPAMKQTMTRWVTKYVTNIATFAESSHMRKEYVLQARRSFNIAAVCKLKYDLKTASTLYHKAVCPKLAKVVEVFFLRITNARSGQRANKRTTFRELTMKLKDVQIKWYSEFPEYCREAAKTWDSWFQELKKKTRLRKFDRDVLAAVESTPASAKLLREELSSRQIVATKKYHEQLRENRFRWREASVCNSLLKNAEFEAKRKLVEEQELSLLEQLDNDEEAEAEEEISVEPATGAEIIPPVAMNPPALKFVFRIIKNLGYTWSGNVYPTECPIHDKGRGDKLQLEKLQENLGKQLQIWQQAAAKLQELTEDAPERKAATTQEHAERTKWASCLQKARNLDRECKLYERHVTQFSICRATIKRIEDHLKPGEAVLYRDFVAQYMTGGGKLSNLVFVVLWNDGDKAQRFNRVMKFNHFCDDADSRSQDSYYVADVWLWFLGQGPLQSGFLKRSHIHTLYVSGDHGPHFSSCATMYLESTFYQKYGIRLFLFFLCSYHAFNRCDGAGVESKKLHESLITQRKAVALAADICQHLNDSEYHNSVGTVFNKINRGSVVFDTELVADDNLDLRGKCEVKYEWTDSNGSIGREDGVILCRNIPHIGEGGEPYDVFDLRKNPPGGALCKLCSKREQKPVRHPGEVCPTAEQIEEANQLEKEACINDGCPSQARLADSGVQLTKSFKKNLQLARGEYPCRVDGCIGFHHYNHVHHANKHMLSVHKLVADDDRLYPKQKTSKKRTACTGRKAKQTTAPKTGNVSSAVKPAPENVANGIKAANPSSAPEAVKPAPENVANGIKAANPSSAPEAGEPVPEHKIKEAQKIECVHPPSTADQEPQTQSNQTYEQRVAAKIAVNKKVFATLVTGNATVRDEISSAQPRKKSKPIKQSDAWTGTDSSYEDDTNGSDHSSKDTDHAESSGAEEPAAPGRQLRARPENVNYNDGDSSEEIVPSPTKTAPSRAPSPLTSPLSGCNKEQVSNVAHPPPRAPSPPLASPLSGYSVKDIHDPSNEGKFVLWLQRNPADEDNDEEAVFFILGAINKKPVWEHGKLFLHTEDLTCSQDTRWPCSLNDAYFFKNKGGGKEEAEDDSWLDVTADNPDVLVLSIFDKLQRKKKSTNRLPKAVCARAMEILQENKHLAHVETFMNKAVEARPRSHRRQKKA